MVAAAIAGNDLAKKINLFCLVAAILIVLLLPFKKEIWYDETVSMLCSKGISHDTPAQFSNATSISSAAIEQFNTSENVFKATVNDNANGFLYNYKLHWLTKMFGNSITVYMLLSKLCAIITLIAFFVLSRQFFGDSIFTSIAVILLVSDLNFINMSHEIRSYAMATMFVVLAAVYFYWFLLLHPKPLYLFLTAAFSVGAIMSHFLSVYIIIVFLGALLLMKGKALFTVPNILAVLPPVLFLASFIYVSFPGLHIMSSQSNTIQEGYANYGFNLTEVFARSLKYTAMNFKVIFPALKDNFAVIIASFLLVLALYRLGIWTSPGNPDKRNLHLLFILGIISTVFMLALSLRSHHYASLYFRYYSFGIPFSCLFIAYMLHTLYYSAKVRSVFKLGLAALLIIPAFAFFARGIMNDTPAVKYNHTIIVAAIEKNNITKIEVPTWRDAFLLQSLLPQGYKIDYFRNPEGVFFTLYKSTGIEKIPAIKE